MQLTPSGLLVDHEEPLAVRDPQEVESALNALDPSPPPVAVDQGEAGQLQVERAKGLEALRILDERGEVPPGYFHPCALHRRDLAGRAERTTARVVVARWATADRPLLLIDGDVPSGPVLDLLAVIDGGVIGVRAGGGTGVFALAVCDDVLIPDTTEDRPVAPQTTFGELIASLDGGPLLIPPYEPLWRVLRRETEMDRPIRPPGAASP